MPGMLQTMIEKLATSYNSINVLCCSCSSGFWTDVVEMELPPIDGYWFAFKSQTDNTHVTPTTLKLDPNCKLMHEPPP